MFFLAYLHWVLESRARPCSARCGAWYYRKVLRPKERAAGTAVVQHKGSTDWRRSRSGAETGRTGLWCRRSACLCSRRLWASRYSSAGWEGSGNDWRRVGSRCCMMGSPWWIVTIPSGWRQRGWAAQSRLPAGKRGSVSWNPLWSWGRRRGSWGWSACNHQRKNHIQSGSVRRRWPVFGTCRWDLQAGRSCALHQGGPVCRPGLNP